MIFFAELFAFFGVLESYLSSSCSFWCLGVFRDLKLLTDSKSKGDVEDYLQAICDDALEDAIDAAKDETHDWSMLEAAPASIDLEEYYSGQGILNDETGNFQQTTSRFKKRPDKFN